jgi:crossover junction endodeoxyribonuclease RuvC
LTFQRNGAHILGIDPGLDGAAALVHSDTRDMTIAVDLPTSGSGPSRCIDEAAFHRWLSSYSIDHCFIENVIGRIGWAAGNNFRFGMACGALRAIVALRGIPYSLVTPGVWKRYHQLIRTDKESSRQRALMLFPKSAHLFERKKDHQRAEAALIALYGLRTQWRTNGAIS